MKLPHFVHALELLQGVNDEERSKKIGIPHRTFTRYKAGQLPPIVFRLVNNPVLLSALLKDAEIDQTQGESQ